MKKWLLLALLLLLPLAALADEAPDLTAQCAFRQSKYKTPVKYLTDRNANTVATADSKKATLEITLPEGEACHGLYIQWGEAEVQPWHLEAMEGEEWVEIASGGGFLHAYIPVDGRTKLRITSDPSATKYLRIRELFVLGEGELPDWVQNWQPPLEKADLLVLSAHADDEWIFFGGAIPDAVNAGKAVQVCYLTSMPPMRRMELLNGLWAAGVRHYPDLSSALRDVKRDTLAEQYRVWGRSKVQALVTGFYGRYRPEVVVSHDVKGEYGHGAHRVAADAAMACVELAADTWQVKKLYLHLYAENEILMDWQRPLEAFGGRTALDIAAEAYGYHVSQHKTHWKIEPGGRYDSSRFGLAYTAVGADVQMNDFFENIPESGDEIVPEGGDEIVPESDESFVIFE